jgi:hypothetical protein
VISTWASWLKRRRGEIRRTMRAVFVLPDEPACRTVGEVRERKAARLASDAAAWARQELRERQALAEDAMAGEEYLRAQLARRGSVFPGE